MVIGWSTPPAQDETSGDAIYYQSIAHNLLTGNGYSFDGKAPTADKLPIYPLFLAATYRFAGLDNYTATRWVQILLASLVPLFTFLLGKNILSERVALIAAVLTAVDPVLTYFAPAYLSEWLYTLLLLAAVLVFSGLLEEFSWRRLAVGGVLVGTAMLTHGNAVFLPMLLAGWCILVWKRSGIQRGASVLLIAGAVMMPWILRNYLELGTFIPFTTNGGSAFYGGNNRYAQGNWLVNSAQTDLPRAMATSEIENDRENYRLGLEWITNHTFDFVALLPKKVIRLFDFDPHTSRQNVATLYRLAGLIPYGLMLPFILAGMFALVRARSLWLLYAIMGAALINTLIFYGDSRFRAPLQPYLYIFGAWALVYAWNWARRGWAEPAHSDVGRDANGATY